MARPANRDEDADLIEWALLPWLSFMMSIGWTGIGRIESTGTASLASRVPFRATQYLVGLPRGRVLVTAHGDRKIAAALSGRTLTSNPDRSDVHFAHPTPASREAAARLVDALSALPPENFDDEGQLRRWKGWVHRHSAQLAAYLSLYRRRDWRDVDVFVTAQPVLGPARVLLAVLEERGVPVVHIAETQITSWVKDLPAGYVALRGRREAEYYERVHGVPASTITVVGNPTTDILRLPLPAIDSDARGVLALSNYSAEVIEETIRRVAEAGVEHIIVAPHPTNDRALIRSLVPSGWTLHERTSTLDLLRTGPSYLLHSASGVAWEAAALGIPVADVGVAPTGVAGQYPFLEDPELSAPMNSADDLRHFLQPDHLASQDRAGIRAAAVGWCAVDGDQARERVRALIEEAFIGGPKPRLLDGWAPGGPAWMASPLTRLWR